MLLARKLTENSYELSADDNLHYRSVMVCRKTVSHPSKSVPQYLAAGSSQLIHQMALPVPCLGHSTDCPNSSLCECLPPALQQLIAHRHHAH